MGQDRIVNSLYKGMISFISSFHSIFVLRIYESSANTSILMAKYSSDFFCMDIDNGSRFQWRFSWGKSKNKNSRLASKEFTKLGTGMKNWEEKKDSEGFGFMKCQTLCYVSVISINLVGFVLPLHF